LIGGVALTVVFVTALCWLPFVRGLTRSIAQMDQVTTQIAEGHFDARADTNRKDEIGHLARNINHLGTRLQSFVRGQKRFLGDISHELCAPIARIQFALGILENRASNDLKPHVAVLNEEIQEMSGLVNELLSFSKAGLQTDAVPVAPVALAYVAQKAVAKETFGSATVDIAIPLNLIVTANEMLLLRALSNIVRNAIRYAGDRGPIGITAERSGDFIELIVGDHGPGVPPEELEDVFAPFYRLESARSRETGGTGLGLAIVRTCVEACGGTVACRNRQPTGLEVVIRLRAA
jgi:two-component system sensor histidine kinase CpxA